MTITAVAQPAGTPPVVLLTISSPDGSSFTAISLTRTQNGLTVPVRVQPVPGPSPTLVYDYEALWELPAVYTATVTRSGVTETYTSSPVTLAPTIPWMIHPTSPALSMPLDQGLFSAMGVVSIGASTRAALTTKHRILGSEFQIVTKVGPRAAPAFPIVLATVTPAERSGLISLLRDQTPLLIQVPSAWGWDWDANYFDVADVSSERFLQYGPEHRRNVTLNLEAVQAPAGTQQAIRTFATLLGQFASFQAVSAAYATFADVITDSRK